MYMYLEKISTSSTAIAHTVLRNDRGIPARTVFASSVAGASRNERLYQRLIGTMIATATSAKTANQAKGARPYGATRTATRSGPNA